MHHPEYTATHEWPADSPQGRRDLAYLLRCALAGPLGRTGGPWLRFHLSEAVERLESQGRA